MLPLDLGSVGLTCSIPLVNGRFKISAAFGTTPHIELSLRASGGYAAWSYVSPSFSQVGLHAHLPQASVNAVISLGYHTVTGPSVACITLNGPEHTVTASAGFTHVDLSGEHPVIRHRFHFSVRSASGAKVAGWYDSDEEFNGLRVMKASLPLGTLTLSGAAAWGRETKICGEVTWDPDSSWRIKASIGYTNHPSPFTSTVMLQYDVRSDPERKRRRHMI
jgi:hypothetical protein